jgi:2-polyprenyl-6-hydroxyphenyl methylase/3-demethylubiquinone-9 3-methyltransferase
MNAYGNVSSFAHDGPELSSCHTYVLPRVLRELNALGYGAGTRVFDLGYGNGSVANELARCGFRVTGADPSASGARIACAHFPELDLHQASSDDDLHATFGEYPVVISLEVIEHVYSPRRYASTLFSLVAPGGVAIVSTPYHGYWKNLALAVAGRMDMHFMALVEGGHIKFWSRKTLTQLMLEAGFSDIRLGSAGRLPIVAKSMIAVLRK